METPLIPVIIAIVTIFGITILIMWAAKYSKKKKNKIAEVATAIGAEFEPGNWKTQPLMRGQIGKRDYIVTFHVVSTGKSQVTYLDLKTPIETSIQKLAVRKASGTGRFFKKIGLNNPLSSGDPYFDKKVAVKGDPEQEILSILYGGYFKEPAVQLTERKYAVDMKGEELVASKVYSFKKDMNEPALRNDLTNLIALAESIEKR